MKKLLFILSFLTVCFASHAQQTLNYNPLRIVGHTAIAKGNTSNPDSSSLLEVGYDSTKFAYYFHPGFKDSVRSPKNGMIICNIPDSSYYFYYLQWWKIISIKDTSWLATKQFALQHGGGSSFDSTYMKRQIDSALRAADSNLLGGYVSYFMFQMMINNVWTKAQMDSLLTARGYLTTVPWSIITGKPLFATVATTGSYTDLINLPVIVAPADLADSIDTIRAWALNKFYPFSNPNGYINGTPVIDSSLAIWQRVVNLPAYGISPTDLTHWNAAYNKYVVSAAFNSVTGNYILTLNDGSTITASLDGRYLLKSDWVADSTAIQDSLLTKVSLPKYVRDSIQNAQNIADSLTQARAWVSSQNYLQSETDPFSPHLGGDIGRDDTIGTKDTNKVYLIANSSVIAQIDSSQFLSNKPLKVIDTSSLYTMKYGYQFNGRYTFASFPIAVVRPADTNKIFAFDVMPNGIVSQNAGNGYCWMDVCDSDISHNGKQNVGTARMGIFNNHAEFGSRIFGVHVKVPTWIEVNGNTVIECDTFNRATIHNIPTASGTIYPVFVDANGLVQKGNSTSGIPTSLAGWGITNGVTNTTTVNGHALSSNVNVTYSDLGTVPIANGGTGQTTANAALNALLPTQAGNSGKFLTTDGTNTSWAAVSGSGTVTSVATGFGLIGGTITTSGTLQADTTHIVSVANLNTQQALNVKLAGSYSDPTWLTALAYSKLIGMPTTLSGYGITDAYTKTASDARYLQANQTITISGDASGSGTTSIGLTVNAIKGVTVPTLSTGFLKYNGTSWVFDNSSYLTANQSISFAPTGDVTGSTSGTTSLAPTLSIGAGKVTNAMLAGSIDLTTKVTGVLPIANGGTNSTATPTAGGIAYGTGTANAYTAASTAGNPIVSGGASAPTFEVLAEQTITDGATITFNAANGINQKVTLGGNRTLVISNAIAGKIYLLRIIQDGTGSRTITWPATFKWSQGTAPTLTTTASHYDIVTFYYDGTNYNANFGGDYR